LQFNGGKGKYPGKKSKNYNNLRPGNFAKIMPKRCIIFYNQDKIIHNMKIKVAANTLLALTAKKKCHLKKLVQYETF
jgi:hypothetical protein